MEDEKHGKTDLFCGGQYWVQAGPIYIGKEDRDKVISNISLELT
jgi:hypothetical protein